MQLHANSQPDFSAADLSDPERQLVARYHSRRHGWKRFARDFRGRREPLLATLPGFPDAVLVAGCQRSGTTMLTRILARARGFRRFELTHDDELDAALILAGALRLPTGGRYCFQTTYLNERAPEYRNLGPAQKLIWVVRNPYSVVFSMVYNWRRYALTELYAACGGDGGGPADAGVRWWERFGTGGWIERASRAYAGKAAQIFAIREWLGPRLLVVDYDAMVRDPQAWLPRIFAFVDEPFDAGYIGAVRRDSVAKARKLSDTERAVVARLAEPVYRHSLQLVDRPLPAA